MKITFRHYHHAQDYRRISEFLIRHHQPGNADGNWIEPAWEYMHFHPALESEHLGKIGLWEQAREIVAVCHYEWHLGETFFQFHPDYRHLREAMLDYAEANLAGVSERDGRKYFCAYVNDNDPEFLALVQSRGYEKDPEGTRPMYGFKIPNPFPAIQLPDGFHLTSLAEEPDWAKVHQVLWRGFNHGDDAPMNETEFESRRVMFDTPKARRDLKIAAAPRMGILSHSAACSTNRAGNSTTLSQSPPLRVTVASAWAKPPCWKASTAVGNWARP
jgi:hypothetical protein